jgi:hypothetical protein
MCFERKEDKNLFEWLSFIACVLKERRTKKFVGREFTRFQEMDKAVVVIVAVVVVIAKASSFASHCAPLFADCCFAWSRPLFIGGFPTPPLLSRASVVLRLCLVVSSRCIAPLLGLSIILPSCHRAPIVMILVLLFGWLMRRL